MPYNIPQTLFTLSQMSEKRLGKDSAYSHGLSGKSPFHLPSFILHSLLFLNLHLLSQAPLRPSLRAPLEHFTSGRVENYLASLIVPSSRVLVTCSSTPWISNLQTNCCFLTGSFSKWFINVFEMINSVKVTHKWIIANLFLFDSFVPVDS